jgi:hypothetical protein
MEEVRKEDLSQSGPTKKKIIIIAIIATCFIVIVGLVIYFLLDKDTFSDKEGTVQNCDDLNECTSDVFDSNLGACVNKHVTLPETVQYNLDDPRDYLNPLLSALTSDNDNVVKCFFEDTVTEEEIYGYINLTKDFKSYTFIISSWTPNNIVDVSVSDPDFEMHSTSFFMRKVDGLWKVIKVEDVDNIFL